MTGNEDRPDISVNQQNEAGRDGYAAGRDINIHHYHDGSRPHPAGLGRMRSWWLKLSPAERIAGVISVVVIFTGSLAAGVISVSPGVVSKDRGATLSDSPSAQALGMTAGVSDQLYRIFLPISNSHLSDQQVKQIGLIMTFPGPPCAEVPVVLYRISNAIAIDRPGRAAQGSVSAETSPARGFSVPSVGKLNFGCGEDQLHLTFSPPALLLQGNSTTLVEIDVPRRLLVDYEFVPSKGPLRTWVTLPSVDDTGTNGINYMAFRVTAHIGNGDGVDSCFISGRTLPVAVQGSQNCNSKIGGTAVFQPIE